MTLLSTTLGFFPVAVVGGAVGVVEPDVDELSSWIDVGREKLGRPSRGGCSPIGVEGTDPMLRLVLNQLGGCGLAYSLLT